MTHVDRCVLQASDEACVIVGGRKCGVGKLRDVEHAGGIVTSSDSVPVRAVRTASRSVGHLQSNDTKVLMYVNSAEVRRRLFGGTRRQGPVLTPAIS